MISIGDITCDVNGSIEFLVKDTQIDDPFYVYDFKRRCTHESSKGDGVLVMGIDILPSELPHEASSYFGDKLIDYVPELAMSSISRPLVSPELQGAMITCSGSLTPNFQYITKMRQEKQRGRSLDSATEGRTLLLQGHLFDTNLINQALDLIEATGVGFTIEDCLVRPNNGPPRTSSMVINIQASSAAAIDDLVGKLQQLVELVTHAQAMVTELPFGSKPKFII